MQIKSPKPTDHPRYAGLWPRLAALVIDFLLLSLLFFPITKVVKGVWIMTGSDHLWEYGWFITDPLCLIFLAVIVVYFILLEGIFGATIGKKVMDLRVVRTDGHKPGMARSAARNLLRAIDALPAFSILGIVLIVTSPEKARFGDRVAGTRVIIRRR
ncbi:MAG: RDD family protein [FCB group bacterium]|nr:RDD family protein [FCB group bacterium]